MRNKGPKCNIIVLALLYIEITNNTSRTKDQSRERDCRCKVYWICDESKFFNQSKTRDVWPRVVWSRSWSRSSRATWVIGVVFSSPYLGSSSFPFNLKSFTSTRSSKLKEWLESELTEHPVLSIQLCSFSCFEWLEWGVAVPEIGSAPVERDVEAGSSLGPLLTCSFDFSDDGVIGRIENLACHSCPMADNCCAWTAKILSSASEVARLRVVDVVGDKPGAGWDEKEVSPKRWVSDWSDESERSANDRAS